MPEKVIKLRSAWGPWVLYALDGPRYRFDFLLAELERAVSFANFPRLAKAPNDKGASPSMPCNSDIWSAIRAPAPPPVP